MTRRVWTSIPPSTIVPVAGSRAICPATHNKPPARTACTYGPTAAGASFVWIVFLVITRLLSSSSRDPRDVPHPVELSNACDHALHLLAVGHGHHDRDARVVAFERLGVHVADVGLLVRDDRDDLR